MRQPQPHRCGLGFHVVGAYPKHLGCRSTADEIGHTVSQGMVGSMDSWKHGGAGTVTFVMVR
ncbi:hypothetical protein, partial [Pseudomonas sp. FW306-02-H05-AB]|uniref:hypothetical protein n=1 Tax=Pseudomonas sp. FW306-02-H05-AB TaxID=2070666 RepID=UPI001C459676